MSVSSIDYNKTVQTYESKNKTATDTNKKETTSEKKTNYDTYEKGTSTNTSYDRAEAQKAVKAAENAKAQSMQTLLNSMLKTQYGKYLKAMPSSNLKNYFSNLEVDDATRLQAQQDISEDGYWGVKQTAGRILDFAKALAGDDPEKLEEMKAAVQKGFKLAEDMWGGSLPGISQQTYDKVMEGFDEWSKAISEKQAGATEAVNK